MSHTDQAATIRESNYHDQAAISGYRFQNWRTDIKPPLIINPEASLHALVAWCWGEAEEMGAITLGENSEFLASELHSRLNALAAMLEHLGTLTARMEDTK